MSLMLVVMPLLNEVQFLEIAVRSVMEQDYPNVELIVADGMSTDARQEVQMQMQAEYGERLRWSSLQDGGAAEALNQTHGDVVGWRNSDGMYKQGAAARSMAHFVKYPNHQVMYIEYQNINVTGEVLGNYLGHLQSSPFDE